jgi:rhamnose transport system substrate-binding protein
MKKLLYVMVTLSLLLVLVPLASAQEKAKVACEEDYIVQSTDTLTKLAAKYFGDSKAYVAIMEATNRAGAGYAQITDPNKIVAGWKLCIPSAADAQTLMAEAGTAAPKAAPTSKMVNMHYKLYMLAKNSGNPYFEQNSKPGAQEAATELGDDLTFTAPAQPTAAEQITMIDAAIAQKVNAVMVSADDPAALVPVMQKAVKAGITVVTWDSDVLPEGRQLFQNQADAEGIGRAQVKIMCEELGGPNQCAGKVAILSAAATMANQNTWIKWMLEEWKKPEYSKMEYVGTVYGDDLPEKSYNEALGLFKTYPDLKGIISPTSVGVAAAARALEDQKLAGKIQLTGLGLPSQLKQYVKDGTLTKFALWVPKDQGYLTVYMAHLLISGEIKGTEGETFTAGRLGKFTVGKDGVVLLGPPTEFDKNNIDNYNF